MSGVATRSQQCNEGQHQWCGGAVSPGDLHRRACDCACHNKPKGERAPVEEPEDSICFSEAA